MKCRGELRSVRNGPDVTVESSDLCFNFLSAMPEKWVTVGLRQCCSWLFAELRFPMSNPLNQHKCHQTDTARLGEV